VDIGVFPGALPAHLREYEIAGNHSIAKRPFYIDIFLNLELIEDGFDDAEAQAHGIGDVAAGYLTTRVQNVEDDVLDDGLGESGIFNGIRHAWGKAVVAGPVLRKHGYRWSLVSLSRLFNTYVGELDTGQGRYQ